MLSCRFSLCKCKNVTDWRKRTTVCDISRQSLPERCHEHGLSCLWPAFARISACFWSDRVCKFLLIKDLPNETIHILRGFANSLRDPVYEGSDEENVSAFSSRLEVRNTINN